MTLHHSRTHHRPFIRWDPWTRRWLAFCPCGWAHYSHGWHEALVFANAHAETLL